MKTEHAEFPALPQRSQQALEPHGKGRRVGESKGLALVVPRSTLGGQVREEDSAWLRLICPRPALTVLHGVLLKASGSSFTVPSAEETPTVPQESPTAGTGGRQGAAASLLCLRLLKDPNPHFLPLQPCSTRHQAGVSWHGGSFRAGSNKEWGTQHLLSNRH